MVAGTSLNCYKDENRTHIVRYFRSGGEPTLLAVFYIEQQDGVFENSH
jgi:hypothetical protein